MVLPDSLTESVAGVIAAQFGELCPITVTYLGEGYASTAFDVNGRWVFRFPKREDVERQLVVESAMLPQLAPRTEVPIPNYSFQGVPSPAFPRHFVGYPRLAGVPGIGLDPARIPFACLAPVLGRFLSALHAFPAGTARRRGTPEYPSAALIEEVKEEALSDFHVIRRVASGLPEDRLRSLLEARVAASCMAPAVVHSDLAAEHVRDRRPRLRPGAGATRVCRRRASGAPVVPGPAGSLARLTSPSGPAHPARSDAGSPHPS